MSVSFKWHGPGGCCCEEPGPYDWYRDASATDGLTLDTEYFARVPSVITSPPMNSTPGAHNHSISCWYIINTGEVDKSVMMSGLGGFQSTGGLVSEIVITQETRTDGDIYLVFYDCLNADPDGSPANPYGVEIDHYKYVYEDGVSDYEYRHPQPNWTMNHGWAEGNLSFEGIGTGYDKWIRGIVDFDPVVLTDPGIWVEFECDAGTISKNTIEFDTTPMTDGEALGVLWQDDPPNPNTTVYHWLWNAIPQVAIPRYWPYAAGVEHEHAKYYLGPPDTEEVTVEPSAKCVVGPMGCVAGVPLGEFSFPGTVNNTGVCEESDLSGITGAWGNIKLLHDRHRLDVEMADASPGGYILVLMYRLTEWSGDIGIYPPTTFTTWFKYYVRLYVGSHGSNNPTPIGEYETDDDWGHLWGTTCHAVHKHPNVDDYWLFCIPYRSLLTGAWRLRCYRADGTLHWESPPSTDEDPPIVLWSSDRWIHVQNLVLDNDDVDLVTRGVWSGSWGDWLISHNPEDHPEETEDYPYYVPAGTRIISGGVTTLYENWMSGSSSDIQYDVVKTSRLLPCVPPDEPY